MCLATPMRVIAINGPVARVESAGVELDAGLDLVEEVAVGDYVIVHAGFALHKIDEADAMASLRLLKEAAEFAEKKEREV